MALHARLTPAPSPQHKDAPWHKVDWIGVPARLLWQGERRMEAENFLSSGYGLKIAIQERQQYWKPLTELALVWQPKRLKGIQVGPDGGTPFLAATQVFDIRPFPHKWLAVPRTPDAASRFVTNGLILVTCSGDVGRVTLGNVTHSEKLVSHDLLRLVPRDSDMWGWAYAFLHSRQGKAMMKGSQYGHIIKHLEVKHLQDIPVPVVKDSIASKFQEQVNEILRLRNRAHKLVLDAERRYEKALGVLIYISDVGENGFTVRASEGIQHGRRRLEAAAYNPAAREIRQFLGKAKAVVPLGDLGLDIWVPSRYKRVPAPDGIPYYDSANLLEVSPSPMKRFADCDFGDKFRGRVEKDWILIPCSGQVYGIIGTPVLAGAFFHGQVLSNHVIRVKHRGNPKIRFGFLVTALGNPKLGRPLLKSLAFGSSVPEIHPEDLRRVPIPRFSKKVEEAIADASEEAAEIRGKADILEKRLGEDATELIDAFLEGRKDSFAD